MTARRSATPGRGDRILGRPFLLLAIWLLALPAAAGPAEEEIENLVRAGSPQLALRVIDDLQPDAAEDTPGWLQWESRRLSLLRDTGSWAELARRPADHPLQLPAPFIDWARTLQSEAQVELGDGEAARALLRTLIWRARPAADPAALAHWRRLVIRSYLAESRHDDAYQAMLRHRQDYGDGDTDFRHLQARVLLQSGRPADALRTLGDDPTVPAEPLRLLAALRSGSEAPAEIYRRATERAAGGSKNPLPAADRARFLAVALAAAVALKEPAARIDSLEAGLQLPPSGRRDPLLPLEPDDLWTAYLELGEQLGNRARLLVGDDRAWAALAETELAKRPREARALFATLAVTGRDLAMRQQGHARLIGQLATLPDGKRVMRRLYLDSRRYRDYAALPDAIRYTLADDALSSGDFRLASQLLAGLDTPPPNSDLFDWRLRRARILILGGDRSGGADALDRLIGEMPEQSVTQINRLLQVLFDLQTVGEHDLAIERFAALLALPIEARHAREILYWSADSHRKRGRHLPAARLYLRSATLLDPYSMDDWAQTARYQAARELTEAGLLDDAGALLQGLLNATRDAARRATLERDLQQLRLLDGREPR